MSGMDKTRFGWVVFSYVTLGGVYLLLGYVAPALDQTLTTAIELTFLFSAAFLAFQGYNAVMSDNGTPSRKTGARATTNVTTEALLPSATCRCGRTFVKTSNKQSACTDCFFLAAVPRAFPRS